MFETYMEMGSELSRFRFGEGMWCEGTTASLKFQCKGSVVLSQSLKPALKPGLLLPLRLNLTVGAKPQNYLVYKEL